MTSQRWKIETDVIVVGAGLAGYCAALEAAAAGAEVVLLEREAAIGGSTLLSSGFFAFAGTDLQQAACVADSDSRLLADLKTAGGGHNDERLLEVYVAHQLQTYAWLKNLGIAFKPLQLSSAQSVPRTHPLDPAILLERLQHACGKSGRVTTLCNSPALRLIQDQPGGRVLGVEALVSGDKSLLRARRGVVLSSGGFSRNEAMLKAYVPQQAKGVLYGGDGSQGDGIRMAQALGAGLRDMALVKGTFGFHPDARTKPGRDWTKLPIYQGAIAVNKHAQRFVDESKSYKLLGDAVLAQPDAIAYQIFDQAIMDKGVDDVPPFDFQSALKRGLVIAAGSIAELAAKISLDATTLTATVERYNSLVDHGADSDFGRDGLSTHYGKLPTIRRAPFFAYPCTSGIIATYCGLIVDSETRVHDAYGEAISGLFAAGELMGGFHGESYMTGSSLGKCVIFGRIAGRNAAGI